MTVAQAFKPGNGSAQGKRSPVGTTEVRVFFQSSLRDFPRVGRAGHPTDLSVAAEPQRGAMRQPRAPARRSRGKPWVDGSQYDRSPEGA